MRYLRHITILFILLLSTVSSTLGQATARNAAAHFYSTYLALKVRGLPNIRQSKLLLPLLTPDLQQMFAAAEREQNKFSKEHPDEKPPWGDGDLFSSLFEGAQSFTLGEPK